MGKRGPKPGSQANRARDETGHFMPIVAEERGRVGRGWTPAEILSVIEPNYGLRTQIANRLGCSLQTVRRYAKEFPEIQEALANQDDRVNDLAELSLIRAIIKGEAWAVCFRLKTRAKDRGYVERKEVSGPGGGPIQHQDLDIDVSMLTDEQNAQLQELLGAITAAQELVTRPTP